MVDIRDLRLVSPQLVGRTAELDRLRGALDDATRGAGQCVLIAGEAGIGKSRLVSELRLEFTGRVLVAPCYEEDAAVPLAPLAAGLRRLLAESDGAAISAFDRRTADLVRLLPELAGRAAVPSTATAADPAASQRALFEALAGLLFDLDARTPLLILFEDLHWCDESTAAFIRFLARRLADRPILLIGAYRPAERPLHLSTLLTQLERERLADQIELRPLAREEVDALLRALFESARPISAEFLDTVSTFSEGNPLFVEELVRAMVQAGDIYQVDGVWARVPAHQLRVPRSVEDAVIARAARLSPDGRQLLRVAAVAGRQFEFGLLEQVTGFDEARLVAALKELIAAHLVREDSADAFAFVHPLVREAVQAPLLSRERRSLHGQIAATLERLHPANTSAYAPELAYHYFEAEAWEHAYPFAQLAAENARCLDATGEAIAQYSRALACARRLSMNVPIDLLLARAELNERTGAFDAADADLNTALVEAERTGQDHERWQAALKLGFLWTTRDYDRSVAWLERALDAAERLPDPLIRAETLNRIGNVRLNRNEPALALPYHQEALAAFEAAGDVSGRASTLELLAVTYYNLPDLLAGAECDERALELARTADNRSVIFHASIHLLLPLRLDTEVAPPADPQRLIRQADEARALAHAMGWPGGEAQALGLLGEFHGLLGDYDRGLACVRESLRMAQQLDYPVGMAAGERLVAWLLMDLLAFDEASERLRRAMHLAEEAGARLFGNIAALALAQTLIARRAPGDLDEAADLLDALRDDDSPAEYRSAREAACVQAELALARGDALTALGILQDLISTTRHLDARVMGGAPRLALLLGRALAASGSLAEAEEAMEAAVEGARSQGRRPLLWRCHAELGRLYLARKQRRAARDAFARARTLVDELAVSVPDIPLRESFRARAQAMLPLPPAPTARRAAKEAHHGLTEREWSVARLVAGGSSNREIADALVISERTAERHVTNILAKLGLASRVQLAAWTVEHGRSDG